jgi:parallel beta-helix repeat protein
LDNCRKISEIFRGNKMRFSIFLFLVLGITFVLGLGAVSAATIDVGPTYTYTNITSGIAAASANDTIVVHNNPSNYTEEVVVNKAGLNITSAPGDSVTVQNTGSGSVFTISSVNFVSISGFIIQGNDSSTGTGVTLTNANNCNIANNIIQNSWKGVGVTGSNNIISGNTIYNTLIGVSYIYPSNNNTAIGNNISNPSYNQDTQVRLGMREDGYYFGSWTPNQNNKYLNNVISNVNEGIFIQQGSNFTISGNTITIKDTVNYPWAITLSVGNTANQVMILNNNMITAEGNSGFGSRGIYLISNPSSPSNAVFNFYGNSLTNFGEGFYSNLYTPTGSSTAQLYLNRIYNNTHGVNLISSNTIFNLTNNWWGKNDGLTVYTSAPPATYDIYYNAGTVTYNPWLVLNATANPTTILNFANSTITANLTYNSNGIDTTTLYGGKTVINGIPVNFSSDSLGTVNPAASTLTSGMATTIFTSGIAAGNSTVSTLVDGFTVNTLINIITRVTNTRTNTSYYDIQPAIDDPATLNGDTLTVANGPYIENVVVNKQLNLIAQGLVVVNPINTALAVITITNTGSGTLLQGFDITGATGASGLILNSASNCLITSNNISSNGVIGILLLGGSGNTILNNLAINNGWAGIVLDNSALNNITGNLVSGSSTGIYLGNNANLNILQNNNVTSNTANGIEITGSSNNQITGNDINNNAMAGILLSSATGNSINTNTLINNGFANIVLDNSTGNNLNGGNTISGGQNGIYLGTNSMNNLISQNYITLNTANGIWSVTSLNNILNNNIINIGTNGIFLNGATQTHIMSNTINGSGVIGLLLAGSSDNNTITGNSLNNNLWTGICLDNSAGNTINGANTVYGGENGLYLGNNANNNQVTQNVFTMGSANGIWVDNSVGNTINQNNINNNGIIGVLISNGGTGNNLTYNSIQQNGWAGVCIVSSSGNNMNHNNFISNPEQAYDDSTNNWDNGVTGNYWNDWPTTTPRPISGGSNTDNFPSTTPF